jgi:signal peptidase I
MDVQGRGGSGQRAPFLWRHLPPRLADLLSSRRFRVQGRSMEPSLRDRDLVLASRAAYLRRAPVRGEVVLVRLPTGDEYVKRVVGLPGEHVRVEGGCPAINGVPLDEPYRASLGALAAVRDGSWHVGQGEYFLLGDNRSDSLDSRLLGPAPSAWIQGRVWHRTGPSGKGDRFPPVSR